MPLTDTLIMNTKTRAVAKTDLNTTVDLQVNEFGKWVDAGKFLITIVRTNGVHGRFVGETRDAVFNRSDVRVVKS